MEHKDFRPSPPAGKAFFVALLSLIISLLTVFPAAALTEGEALSVRIVQFEMDSTMVESEQAYRLAVTEAAEKAMAAGEADLLIFPEYLGVFSALIPYAPVISSGLPFQQIWMSIRREQPELQSIRDLFISTAERNEAFLDGVWGDLARRFDVYILSGSRLSPSPTGDRLYNHAVVYGPDGSVFYGQNKYFLTDFETDILGLDSGDPRECRGFVIKDRLIRLTICRDTFLRDWESLYDEGYLWIDIKANGVPYTPDQEELFTRALPARLKNTDIRWGITACLTGDFLDLLWEGESSILRNEDGRVEYRARSRKSDGFEILAYEFP